MGDKFTNSITPLTFTLNKIGLTNGEGIGNNKLPLKHTFLIYEIKGSLQTDEKGQKLTSL